MDIIMIIGRVLFALVFVASGLNHLTKAKSMVGYAQFKKVPMPLPSIYISGVVMVLGALSVVLGIYADLGALALAVLLVMMAFKMHDFWAQSDAQAKQAETAGFFKNMSMAGAALVFFALIADGHEFGPHVGDMLSLFNG